MKRLIALILAVSMLSGCSLAMEAVDGDGIVANHELTGFLLTVTLEENGTITDVWDEESAGMEPLHLFTMEGEKLYAQRIEGERPSYEFPEGCGLQCFCYYIFSDEEGETYRADTTDPELADVKREVHVSNGSKYHLEATIYATEDCAATVFMNPVYQTPEGEVYAIGTAAMGYDAASMYGCSETLEQQTRIKIGEETSLGGTVKLNIERVVLPDHYIIIEMDEHNQPLKQTEFAPGALPEIYVPGADASYLLLEARAGEDTTRTVYSPGDEGRRMDTFYPGQYGLCIKGYTRIQWEGDV